MGGHRSQKCFFEGCDRNAPYGKRLSGPLSKVPEGYRGYLWHCEAHEDEARGRRDAAEAKAKSEGKVEPEQLDMIAYIRDAG